MNIPHPTAEQLAFALDGRRVGNSYRARCPAHEDRTPSFTISEKHDRVLFRCWAGCSQNEVIDALRSMRLWPRPCEAEPVKASHKREVLIASVAAHETMLRRGIPVSAIAQREYHRAQRHLYAPFSAAEVAEMHLFCLVYDHAVKRYVAPSPKDTDQYCVYAAALVGRPMPYEY